MAEHAAHAMSAADAAWLHMDRATNLMVINAVLWFDDPLDWEATQAVFTERIVERFPRFRQRIDEGTPGRPPVWRDVAAFEPRLHFHRQALPAPGDQATLQEIVSDLIATPLYRDRPLWDVYLFEGYGRGSALLVRMHHAIADGIALARVLLSATDSPQRHAGFSEQETASPSPVDPARAALHAGKSLAAAGLDVVTHPERLGDMARTVAGDGRALVKFLVPGSDTDTGLRGDLAIGHRVAWSEPVSLATVKRAGKAMDATINDVLVAAVAGSVGRHLRGRGEDVDELHALVPFNLRALDEPLPRELGNRFGLLLLGLPVGIDDPVERVRAVQATMGAIKRSHEGAIAYGILSAIGHTPRRIERLLVDFFSAKGTMVLTNVPGPRRAVTLAGVPVAGILVWAPCSGSVGMSVSVFSSAGKVTVGFLVDDALVDDPQQLADDFRRELLRTARRARAVAAHS